MRVLQWQLHRQGLNLPGPGHHGDMTHRAFSCLVTSLALAGTVLVSASADAAATWTTIQSTDGAKLQGCKVKLSKGWRLKVRLVNASDHGHQAGVTVRRDGDLVDRAYFKVIDRRISKVRSVGVRPGDILSAGMAEADDTGGGGGGQFTLPTVRKC